MRLETAIRISFALFFVSGATALAYQVVWARELQLVFGTSTFAVSTVLASFMAGLAAGAFVIARFADRARRPLAVYGWLEIGIGLFALLFASLLAALTPLYLEAARALQPGPVAFGMLQFGLVAALLVVPTAAMGATLPLLAHFAVQRLGAAGDRVGTLYSANTLGAVAGIALCGFVLLPKLGLAATTVVAAVANLALGAAALVVQHGMPAATSRPRAASQPAVVPRRVTFTVSASIGLAGFAALVYEVGWTRLLALMLGSSVYTFSVMLIAFLGGIALGAKLGGRYADRLLDAGGWRRVLMAFALLEIGIAVLAYATMYLYPQLPIWYLRLFEQFGIAERPDIGWWISLLLAGLVMTPPAILMGMHFPMAVRAVVGSRDRLGGPVGAVYGINALGGAAGAFLAGFVLLPRLGLQGTVFTAAMAGCAAAGLLVTCAVQKSRRRWLLTAPIAAAVLALLYATQRPPWNPLLMTAGAYHYAPNFAGLDREDILRYSVDLYELVYYEEGLSSVVTVADNVGTSHRWLAINGKVDASTTDDMPTQILLSLLPMQFVAEPDDVLVIGLASGISAGTAAVFPEVGRLHVAELEPAVGRAARFFERWNHDVLSDPRVSVIYNDGRNHLLLAEPASYDVVVSEPSNPWISGVANLFTREFFELGKSRLKPGGVWSQWVPIYGMDGGDLRSILKTFADVFPHVVVYASIDRNDLVLVGSDAPLPAPAAAADRFSTRPALRAELGRAGVVSDVDLVSLFLMQRDGLQALTTGAPLNTDDNMFVEYSTATKLHLDARDANHALLLEHAALPDATFGGDPARWARLAARYRQQGDVARSDAALARARELAPGLRDGR